MKLWRVTRAPFAALDGEGARLHGSRYAPPGTPAASLASDAALAVLIGPPRCGAVPPLTTRPFSFAETLHRPPLLDAFPAAR